MIRVCLIPPDHNISPDFSRCICFYYKNPTTHTNGKIINAPSLIGVELGNPIINLIEKK